MDEWEKSNKDETFIQKTETKKSPPTGGPPGGPGGDTTYPGGPPVGGPRMSGRIPNVKSTGARLGFFVHRPQDVCVKNVRPRRSQSFNTVKFQLF